MDSIPYSLIVQTCCHTSPHCENQLSSESFLQQLENFLSLFVVRQICSSRSACVVDPISNSSLHMVINSYNPFGMTRKSHNIAKVDSHFTIRLISLHLAKNGRTNGTFGPVFFSNEVVKATHMVFMRAGQHVDVQLGLLGKFLFYLSDLELLETNHALFFLHIIFGQFKLEGRKVAQIEFFLDMRLINVVFLVDERQKKLNGVIVVFPWFELVHAVEFDFKIFILFLLNRKKVLLLLRLYFRCFFVFRLCILRMD